MEVSVDKNDRCEQIIFGTFEQTSYMNLLTEVINVQVFDLFFNGPLKLLLYIKHNTYPTEFFTFNVESGKKAEKEEVII